MFVLNFANDWIQTADLWCLKRPLYQLSYNHCPTLKAKLCSDIINLGVIKLDDFTIDDVKNRIES